MGLYDRDYYRGEEAAGQRLGLPESMLAKIILVNVIVYVVDMFTGDGQVMRWLMVPDTVLVHPWEWWRLLTAAFAHASIGTERGIWHIVMNMFVLYMFGRELEYHYGGKEFLCIYLMFAVAASAIWAACQMILPSPGEHHMLGASGAVAGIVILFVCHYPRRMLAFPPVPAWVAGIGLVVLDALRAAGAAGGDGDDVAYTAHLGGALVGFLYFRSGIRFSRWLPQGRGWKLKNPLQRRPKLRVHDPEKHYQELDRRADEILDKVNRQGVDSISAEERRILDDYSRRMRQKHR